MAETGYVIGVRTVSHGNFVAFDGIDTYDDAVAAFTALNKTKDERGLYPDVVEFVVRSADDPQWKKPSRWTTAYAALQRSEYGHSGRVWGAIRERRRKEIGATALSFIKMAEPGESLTEVETLTKRSLAKRGIEAKPHEVWEAVKARVLLARCHNHDGRKVAWWIRKSEGPMAGHKCPECGSYLYATSGALNASFKRMEG